MQMKSVFNDFEPGCAMAAVADICNRVARVVRQAIPER